MDGSQQTKMCYNASWTTYPSSSLQQALSCCHRKKNPYRPVIMEVLWEETSPQPEYSLFLYVHRCNLWDPYSERRDFLSSSVSKGGNVLTKSNHFRSRLHRCCWQQSRLIVDSLRLYGFCIKWSIFPVRRGCKDTKSRGIKVTVSTHFIGRIANTNQDSHYNLICCRKNWRRPCT
jgi:hypothetical protein